MTEMSSLRAVISGRVQGVFFRAFVQGYALELKLSGLVRNTPGGTVEVVVEGVKTDLEKLVGFLKTGPPGAHVDEVKINWARYTGQYKVFQIRY